MPAKLVLLAILSLLLTASTPLGPLPETFAINYGTRQCGGYWGGDEFVNYDLPQGWNSYDYQYSHGYYIVETDVGSCKVTRSTQLSLAQSCCQQLGTTYVSENVGIRRLTPENFAVQQEFEKSTAQDRANRTQDIVIIIIVFLYIALAVIVIARWLVQNKKR